MVLSRVQFEGRHFMNLFCAGQGFIDIGTNILATNVTIETGFAHQVFRLRPGAADQHGAPTFLQGGREFFKSSDAGGVNGSHIAQTENDDGRQGGKVIGDGHDLVGNTEQKWSVNAIDRGVIGNLLVLQVVGAAVFDVVVGDFGDRGGEGNFADEGEGGKDHADFDGK